MKAFLAEITQNDSAFNDIISRYNIVITFFD